MEKKWYTIVEIIDLETGEILPYRRDIIEKYNVVKKETTTEYEQGIRRVKWLSRRDRQTKLEL